MKRFSEFAKIAVRLSLARRPTDVEKKHDKRALTALTSNELGATSGEYSLSLLRGTRLSKRFNLT